MNFLKLWAAETSQSENLVPISVPVFLALGRSIPFLKIPQSHRFLKKSPSFPTANIKHPFWLKMDLTEVAQKWVQKVRRMRNLLIWRFEMFNVPTHFLLQPQVLGDAWIWFEKNGTQNSMAKTRFFGWDTNPPILPPFYVLSCGTRVQASPVVIRWCDGGWLDKPKHKNTTWTQSNSSEKLSYTIIQSEFKKMSHLQKITFCKKKNSFPQLPNSVFDKQNFPPHTIPRLGKFFSSQATMRSRLRHPVCPVRWSSSWSVGETPTPQTYSSPRSVGLGKWCFGPKKIPPNPRNTQRIKWNI